MQQYDVAKLTQREQEQLRNLEESLGVVLVAYSPTNDAAHPDDVPHTNDQQAYGQPGTCGGL